MPQRISGMNTQWDVLGGHPRTNPPPIRANITVTGDRTDPPPHVVVPTAQARNPTHIQTPVELDRLYRRLHPVRHSIARRMHRMRRERESESEIENQRTAFQRREALMRHAGRERNSEEVRQRALAQWAAFDPLAQFSERSERIFQEARLN